MSLAQVSPSDVVPVRDVVRDGFRATLHWDPVSGTTVELPGISEGIPASSLSRYSAFIDMIHRRDAPAFDFANQCAVVALRDRGFVETLHPFTHEPIWVSQSAVEPWEFATPYLSWDETQAFNSRRTQAMLTLNTLGINCHLDPLRTAIQWDNTEGIDDLTRRAHNLTGHQVEAALMSPEHVTDAADQWRQNRRVEEFVPTLQSRHHVKHSRIARILQESGRSVGARGRGYLHIIDLPGSKRVPLIALRNLYMSREENILREEGLNKVSPELFGRDEVWTRVVSNSLTLWAADASLFDATDAALLGWYRRHMVTSCRPCSRGRGYSI